MLISSKMITIITSISILPLFALISLLLIKINQLENKLMSKDYFDYNNIASKKKPHQKKVLETEKEIKPGESV